MLLSRRFAVTLFCFFFLTFSSLAIAQTSEDTAALRQQAMDLYKQSKFESALPLFEKLNTTNPKDPQILEALALCSLAHAKTLSDPDARKAARLKARDYAKQAQAAGDTSNLIRLFPDEAGDGPESSFSAHAGAEEAMKDAEAAFAKGDFDNAIASYQKALELDPKLYAAALFIGDCYFKKPDHEQAGKWFLRATEIDPNQETAFRYWGDDLMAQNRPEDAREKFVQAIVAQPYDRRSWMGLSQWAKRQNVTLMHPPINPPGAVTTDPNKGQGNINITLDPNSLGPKADADGSSAWTVYSLSKAYWRGDGFHKEFPNEKEYRHTLAEEIACYKMVVDQLHERMKSGKIKEKDLNPSLASLLKISDEGLLPSFVLISKADQGIAQDYPVYRDAHRDLIANYVNRWIIRTAP